MGLTSDLISQFVRATNDKSSSKKESTVYGTAIKYEDKMFVKIDGSDLLTPFTTTVDIENDERVMVTIKNHKATVTGNITSPAARSVDVKEISESILNVDTLIANKVDTEDFEAEKARIDTIQADNVTIKESLSASEAEINTIKTDNVTIKERLTTNEANISKLNTNKLDATTASITYATIGSVEAVNGNLTNLTSTFGEFQVSTTNKLNANDASIKELQTNKLSAEDIEGKYANIDFSNIGSAAMEYFYSHSGLIENVVISEGVITGNLVGVTISGDLIEGNTIKAEKLVIKGTDGLYYKLNTDGMTTEAEQTDQNSLNGSIILANSITASKISVDDLVAFDATIGGFNITDLSIYSGVKSSVDNTTTGLYIDKDGQLSLGDASNFIKYYKDENGDYHLEISAQSVLMSTSTMSIEEAINSTNEYINEVQNVSYSNETRLTTTESTILQLSDSIATLVTDGNGESLMIQTENGWTFSTGEIQNIVDITSENLDKLTNELGDTNSVVEILQQSMDDLGILSEYIKIGTYEGEPCIELGETDSDFKLLITNTRIMFKEGTDIPAYFNNQSMYIKKAVIEEELQQGQFIWKTRSNGNMGLIWKGVTS